MDELNTLSVSCAVLFVLPALARRLFLGRSGEGAVPIVVFIAVHFFCFHAFSALSYGFNLRGVSGLAILMGASLGTTALVCKFFVATTKQLPQEGGSRFNVALALGLAVIAVSTDYLVFRLQGFEFDTGQSRFSAPFAGDHWRHAAIISGLLREDQSIFFPDSSLVYQVLWHQGAAAILSVLPEAVTTFKRELALTLVTALIMYFCIFDSILKMRPQIARYWPLLLLVLALAGTEADLFNAGLSYLKFGNFAFAADSSSTIPSPYRYFSLKLVSLTAPQHAAFFIFAALAVRYLYCVLRPSDEKSGCEWSALRSSLVFAVLGAVFSPVLAALTLPFIYLAAFWRVPAFRGELSRLAKYCAFAVVTVITLHWVILRLAIWAPFLRPNITGGGSGAYGVKLFPAFDLSSGLAANLPWALVSTSGVLGAVLLGLLVWMAVAKRKLLKEPLVLAFLAACIFWNGVLVDTEIQRHSSMAIAFIGLLVVALYLPWKSRWIVSTLVVIPSIFVCVLLNTHFIRAYENNAGFMPLTTGWPDYFCMNDLVRKRFPGMPLVVATPRNFELPIGVEAGPTFVWSQVAAVHQRMTAEQATEMDAINPRDWVTFRKVGETSGEALVDRLKALGFKGAVWGPMEDELYGRALAGVMAKPQRFLASCGYVGLYSFSDSDPRGPVDPVSAHNVFRKHLNAQPEHLLSRELSIDLQSFPSDSKYETAGENVARWGKAAVSGIQPWNAAFVNDGLADEAASPVLLTGNHFLPWWQVDLGTTFNVHSVRIVTPRKKGFPQYELKNVYVLLSDSPFTQLSPLSEARKEGVAVRFISGEIAGDVVVPFGKSGRYLRVQASDQRHLMLTEVEVYSKTSIKP
jgi:hypothetical protein